jgi:membrane protease YdiL (CAAX protease family)
MFWSPGPIGTAAWSLAKVWLLAFPLGWWFLVEKGRVSFSPPRDGGLLVGLASGVLIAAAIWGAYVLAGVSAADAQHVRDLAAKNGLTNPSLYIAGTLYWCLINSLLEEYVWRWFVYRQCETLLPRGAAWLAILFSALFFTLHHIIALAAQFSLGITIAGSLGVFVGGVVWSALYRRYRSIWPGYLSHVFADAPIFVIGWRLIFG